MSYYAWEHGKLILPPTATRQIREALNRELERSNERAIRQIEEFYEQKGSRGRTKDSFRALLEEWDDKQREAIQRMQDHYPGFRVSTPSADEARAAHEAAHDFLYTRMLRGELGRPLKRDLNKAFPKPPKGARKVTYWVEDGSITFDGNELTWQVDDNNHAPERAREHPLGRVLFRELAKVEWTNGTGGQIVGNDEYNSDSRDAGGGANYVVNAFGPLGDPYFVTKAQRASLERSAAKWRQKPGNAGMCGMRTLVNGKRTGPPCRHPALGCPVHRRR